MPGPGQRDTEHTLQDMKVSLEVLKRDMQHITAILDDMRNNVLKEMVTKADLAVRDQRIAALESTQTWIARTIVGAVVLAALSFFITKGGGRP